VDYEEDSEKVNSGCFNCMFAVVDDGELCFSWPVNTGRNQGDDESLCFSASQRLLSPRSLFVTADGSKPWSHPSAIISSAAPLPGSDDENRHDSTILSRCPER
jgi:hypothetical protein